MLLRKVQDDSMERSSKNLPQLTSEHGHANVWIWNQLPVAWRKIFEELLMAHYLHHQKFVRI